MMTDDYITRTLNAYENDPEKYERATADIIPQEDIDEFVNRLPENDLPVLDAGCAFGRDSWQFAQRGLRVIGIDMSDALLKRAKELYPGITFKKMDVRNLELSDESVKGIWCHATLLHLKDDDIRKALREFWRVLVPGGAVFVSFKEGTGDEEFVEKFSSNSARYFNYQTVETVRSLLEENGLAITKIYTFNERERFGGNLRDLNWVYCFGSKA